ncbi:MAG: amidase domain-containing protein, partial [Bacillus sp. (in: firmicutes)]
MLHLIQDLFEKRVNQFVSDKRKHKVFFPKAEKKQTALANRSAEIVKVKASGNIIEMVEENEFQTVKYHAHYQYLIKQKGILYMEEEVEQRLAKFYKEALVMDEEVDSYQTEEPYLEPLTLNSEEEDRSSFQYNRLKAVQYAERWWNSYNPAYKKFENDCTNFISQCL